MPRTVALLGQFGIGNLGNEASLDVGLELARAAGAEPLVITGRPGEVATRRGVVTRALNDPAAPRGGAHGLLGKLADARWAWRSVAAVDAVVVPGTGIFEGLAIRATEAPLTLLWHAWAARLQRKPFLVLSVGADRAASALTRVLFRWAMAASTTLSVRDEQSADAVQALGVRRRPRVVPDLVLGQEPPSGRTAGSGVRPGGVAIGVLAPDGIGTRDGWWDAGDYVARCAALAGALLDAGREVRIVVGAEVDRPTASAVLRQLGGRAGVDVVPAATMGELEQVFVGCDVVVAARYHNLIAALRAAVPVVSLGYGDKQRSLVAAFGLSRFAHAVDAFDPVVVARQVEELAAGREPYRDRIEGELALCRAALAVQAKEVVDVLSAGLTVDGTPAQHEDRAGLSPAEGRHR